MDLKEFGEDSDAAVAAYAAKEQEYEGRNLMEIVLIGSDSLETVKLTQTNYFDGSVVISKYLAGIKSRPRAAVHGHTVVPDSSGRTRTGPEADVVGRARKPLLSTHPADRPTRTRTPRARV